MGNGERVSLASTIATLMMDETRINKPRRFTDDEVREIRRSNLTASALAKQFGVAHPTILNIQKFRTYKEVPDDVDEAPADVYIRMDALTLLESLPPGSCPTVILSPVFSRNYYRSFIDRWAAVQSYIDWQREILAGCIRVAGPAGIVFYQHNPIRQSSNKDQVIAEEIIRDFRRTADIHWTCFQLDHRETNTIFVFAGDGWSSRGQGPLREMSWEVEPDQFRPGSHIGILGEDWYPIPDEVADRCVGLGEGMVLDPIAGTGTVPLVAIRAQRHWLAADTRPVMMREFNLRRGYYESPW